MVTFNHEKQGVLLKSLSLLTYIDEHFFVAILLPHKYHRGNMRQPYMAFVLCQMSSRLQAGA
jgi:hypothetical protein